MAKKGGNGFVIAIATIVAGGVVSYLASRSAASVHPYIVDPVRASGAGSPPRFKNLQMKVTSVHLDQGHVEMNLEVFNPNDKPFDISRFLGTILVNSRPVGDVNMAGDYKVRPNGRILIPLIGQPRLVALVAEVVQMFTKKGKTGTKTPVLFSGSMTVDNKLIPLTLNYTA